MENAALRLDQFLPYRLAYTSNLVSDVIAATYAVPHSLRIPEWRVMTVIAEHDGVSQQAICTRTRMDKVTVSRIAGILEHRGLVARSPNLADRRVRALTLTARGREIHAHITPRALKLEKRIFDALQPDEIAGLVAMLGKIDAIALVALSREEFV